MTDWTPLYLVGALCAFTWLTAKIMELVQLKIEQQEREEQQWEQWITAYERRHGRRS